MFARKSIVRLVVEKATKSVSAHRFTRVTKVSERSLHIGGGRLAAAERFRIYTKTGDKGTSGLFTGDRFPKDDQIFEALGTTDELTSAIGVARQHLKDQATSLDTMLLQVQFRLQEVGSHIATPKTTGKEKIIAKMAFPEEKVEELEHWINELDDQLPVLTQFIIPSGGHASTSLHLARSVCRRAERRVTPLERDGAIDNTVLRYLNRLSDFLFTAARFAAHEAKASVDVYE